MFRQLITNVSWFTNKWMFTVRAPDPGQAEAANISSADSHALADNGKRPHTTISPNRIEIFGRPGKLKLRCFSCRCLVALKELNVTEYNGHSKGRMPAKWRLICPIQLLLAMIAHRVFSDTQILVHDEFPATTRAIFQNPHPKLLYSQWITFCLAGTLKFDTLFDRVMPINQNCASPNGRHSL